jgi:filamentous hemagglutinin
MWEDYKKALTESPTYKAEMQKAIASGASPYLAQLVKDVTLPKDESKITASDIATNAVVGAVVAQLSGQDTARAIE